MTSEDKSGKNSQILEGLISNIDQMHAEQSPETAAQTAPETFVENSVDGIKSKKGGAPVHLWNPDYCGELDMIIEPDGSWIYNKTPIGRKKLVKLFSTVVKREGESYFLVTPVEKIGIIVKDVPFIAISMDVHGEGKDQKLLFTTNVGDSVIAGEHHPLSFISQPLNETIKPYIHIRHDVANGLKAKLSRAVYYELANLAVADEQDENAGFGVWSDGVFFPLNDLANEQSASDRQVNS